MLSVYVALRLAVRVADFSGHVDKGNRGDNQALGGHGAKERNAGQGHGLHGNGFLKRMEILVVKTF